MDGMLFQGVFFSVVCLIAVNFSASRDESYNATSSNDTTPTGESPR